jgi:hypothetical protein
MRRARRPRGPPRGGREPSCRPSRVSSSSKEERTERSVVNRARNELNLREACRPSLDRASRRSHDPPRPRIYCSCGDRARTTQRRREIVTNAQTKSGEVHRRRLLSVGPPCSAFPLRGKSGHVQTRLEVGCCCGLLDFGRGLLEVQRGRAIGRGRGPGRNALVERLHGIRVEREQLRLRKWRTWGLRRRQRPGLDRCVQLRRQLGTARGNPVGLRPFPRGTFPHARYGRARFCAGVTSSCPPTALR